MRLRYRLVRQNGGLVNSGPLFCFSAALSNRQKRLQLPAGQLIVAATLGFMKTVAIYPGSFDPITNGHLDVLRRALSMFDQVIVGVAPNAEKHPLFTTPERVALTRAAVKGIRGVTVDEIDGLLVNYAQRKKARVLVRGLRAVSDFEYEFQMALMNRRLAPNVETIFLMPKDEYTFLSSRLVKEIALLGGNVSDFVPAVVKKALQAKLAAG